MNSARNRAREKNRRPSLLRAYAEFAGAATTRRRSEMRLNAARIEAELSNRAKSEFIAHMSHDLRTPLNAIIGFSDVLANTDMVVNNVPKTKEYASDINHAGRHLLGIINDILDLAKLESGKPELDVGEHDVRDVLHTTMLIANPQAEAKLQLLTTDVSDPVPMLRIDLLRTKQVLINLVSNAIKFTPRCGLIRITAEADVEGCVVIGVNDTGPGMTPEELDVALSRFGRVRNAMTRGQEGTGLGLTIVRHLCEAQGAQFRIRSKPGEGTCAQVVFPRSMTVPETPTS